MLPLATVAELAKENYHKKSPHGCSCKFIKLTPQWGVKLYTKQLIRDWNHERQQQAFSFGYAPAVGDKFEFTMQELLRTATVYGFVTEVAVPYVEGDHSSNDDEYYNNYEKVETERPTLAAEIDAFCNKMGEEIGIWIWDNHFANFGELNGRMVCIDLGE